MSLPFVKFNSKVIRLHPLCELANIDYFTLYRRRNGIYKSELKHQTRTKVANALIRDITPFLNDLGFEVSIKPLAEKTP